MSEGGAPPLPSRLSGGWDSATQVLTPRGWLGVSDLAETDHVAAWADGRIVFEVPLAVTRRERLPGERMVVLETGHRSLRVAADHPLVHRSSAGEWRLSSARDRVGKQGALPVAGRADPLPLEPEQPLPVSEAERYEKVEGAVRNDIRRRGLREEARRDPALRVTLRLEAERRVDRRLALRRRSPTEISLDECALAGFFVGDGTRATIPPNGVEYRLTQAMRYPAIVAWVDDLVARLRLHHSRRVVPERPYAGPHVVWSMPRGNGGMPLRGEGMYALEPYLSKAGTPLLWALDETRLESYLTGLWYADGRHLSGESVPTRLEIHGCEAQLLELLQAVAACRGYDARLYRHGSPRAGGRQMLCLSLSRDGAHHPGSRGLAGAIRLEDPGWREERLWRVRTSSGAIVTRRRGTVAVLGA